MRWLRVAGAAMLMVALVPLTGGQAVASQSGADDHKVTLCHRTNAEKNPYVVITVDKAGVFKTGHDGHDEGGVYQPGDKANGVRWGDIIPPFSYYASPQDERAGNLSQYAGLNWTTEGQAVYNNGCQPATPPPPVEQGEPSGQLVGECVESEGSQFHAKGSFDNDGVEDVTWRLVVDGSDPVAVSQSPFDLEIAAAVGTKLTLEYSTDQGKAWQLADGPITVTKCPPDEPTTPAGSYTVACDADGAVVTIGTLSTDEGVSWVLRVNGSDQPVRSDQKVQVPGSASLALISVKGRNERTRQSGTAPAACPEQGTVVKTSSPASGSLVAPGSSIAYTVTVKNTGTETLTDKKVVDTLPGFVSVSGTPSDSGVVSPNGRTITWTVTLASGASKTLTYTGLVSANAPADTSLVNEVTFLGQRSTTAHTVGRSAEVGSTQSNEVVTEVVAVEAVKKGNTADTSGGSASSGPSTAVLGGKTPASGSLAATGGQLPVGTMIALGGLLMLLGAALLKITTRGSSA